MMWILIEQNVNGKNKKFMGAKNYDRLIKYINTEVIYYKNVMMFVQLI